MRHPLLYKMFGKDFELNGFIVETASDAFLVSKQTLFNMFNFLFQV